MRIKLEHIHKVDKRRADGGVATYYYHRLTRRKITGEPGTPQFLASYQEAELSLVADAGTLGSLAKSFLVSPEFSNLREPTRYDYKRHLTRIVERYGDMPVGALNDRDVRTEFLAWRDSIKSPRQSDYMMSVARRLLQWAYDRGHIEINHLRGVGKRYRSDRSEAIWKQADIDAFLEVCGPSIRQAFLLALFTGQRQGDLLVLPWSAYDGKALRLRQSKTRRRVYIPCAPNLKILLDQSDMVATTILSSPTGKVWTDHNFKHQFGAARDKAGLKGKLTFHDIRGTYVTRRSEDGWTPQEIGGVTGHSLKQIDSILDKYLARTEEIVDAAMLKMRDGG